MEIHLFEESGNQVTVEHCGNSLTYIVDSESRGNHFETRTAINSKGLVVPTLGEAISFLHAAYFNKKESGLAELLTEKLSNPFWTDTIRFLTEEGSYFIDHPELDPETGEILISRSLEDFLNNLEGNFYERDEVKYCRAAPGIKEDSIRFNGSKKSYQEVMTEEFKSPLVQAWAGLHGSKKAYELGHAINSCTAFIGGTNNKYSPNIITPAIYIGKTKDEDPQKQLVLAGDGYQSKRNDGWAIGIKPLPKK